MDTLHELARIAPSVTALSPMERAYLKLLKTGATPEESSKKIFGDVPDANIKISRLGYEVKKKLIAQIATYNAKKNANYSDLATEAHQLFTTGRILLGRQAHKAGVELLEKAFQKAVQAQIIGLALECAEPLADYYAAFAGNKKKYDYYQKAINELLPKSQKERTALSYHRDIMFQFKHNWKPDIGTKAHAYCAITENYIDVSFRAANAHFYTLALAHISDLDHPGLIQACDKAIAYFSKFEKTPATTIHNYYFHKATAHIHLAQYPQALGCTQEIARRAKKGKYGYCSAYFYQGIAGLHSGDIQLTLDAINLVAPYINELPEPFQEQWRILEAYAALFSSRKFKIGKFINEVPLFNKDKAGANAAIIIVQMLHYIKDGRTGDYIERCAALERYTSRYLKGKPKTLAKLLLEVSKGHFNATTVQYRTKRLVKDLNKAERELEIMPAEKVWALVLEWLKQ